MKNKLIFFNVILVALCLLLSFGAGVLVTRNNYYEDAEKRLEEIAAVYKNNYMGAETTAKKVSDNIRVTVIDSAGNVLADSEQLDVSGMENHIKREEVLAALDGDPKTVIRYSDTLGKDMAYYAVKVNTDDSYVFVRVATAVEGVGAYVLKSIPLLLFVLLGAFLCSLIASVIVYNSLLKPFREIGNNLKSVKDGSYKQIVPATGDEDIDKMLININDISEKLRVTIAESDEERERLNYILNNVSDGIIVLAPDGKIMLINRNASAIFGVENAVGRDRSILTFDEKFNRTVNSCFEGKKDSIFEYYTESGTVYLTSVKKLERNITVIVLSDITAVKNTERARSEFFANASHELKTPLTAIKGFNDIISLKTEDETVKDFSQRVDKELDRIILLINDMLDLSKLENGKKFSPVRLSVREAALDVVGMLENLSAEKNISVNVIGDAELFAEKEHVIELIKNLAENGIRYNNEGGFVDISIKDSEKGVEISVKDNGIGIDEIHHARIFERFYRVNKSRSRETGGTGLGLSIVKHICELYHAELSLSSKLGVGTTVKVTFSK